MSLYIYVHHSIIIDVMMLYILYPLYILIDCMNAGTFQTYNHTELN